MEKLSESDKSFMQGVVYCAGYVANESSVLARELLEGFDLTRRLAVKIGSDEFDVNKLDEVRAWPRGK